ncbi:alpha/beta fold hydrolase [Priestia koreensis]|uniref:alpha/beta fold hydrolase n=1 Tax=Priestia koreensis TaxID=284581 RepID=UPI00203B6146|nr:alpha/beta fold hydrolase [Priestia koreensis]MCM3006353.1 alpha/beta fold hydrolase [Priestia koreensis]
MKIENGEYEVLLNRIKHWVKIVGAEHRTIPLVLLHGGPGGNHYVFEKKVEPLLVKQRTLIYYEQRGCGRSESPADEAAYTMDYLVRDFSALYEYLSVKQVDLLGYSFGGELALEIAYAYPTCIRRLVLSAPSLMNAPIQSFVQVAGFMSVASDDILERISRVVSEELPTKTLCEIIWSMVDADTVDSLLFQNQEIAKENRRLWEESGLLNTGIMERVIQQNPPSIPLEKRLKDVLHPSIILTGAFDRNTGIPVATAIHQQLPRNEIVLFPRSAHFPDLEETETFVKQVAEFLNRNDG